MSQFGGALYKVTKPTIAFLVFSYLASIAAIILNILEIHMIVKKWKKASDFEIVLLNLAGADLLSGFGFIAASGVSTWSYVVGRRETLMMTFVGVIVLFSVSSSVTFVIVIAGERLTAVKHPLKHRLWHSNRRNLFKACVLTWLFNFIIVLVAVLTDEVLTGVRGSRNLQYATAGYLTLGIVIVFVLYASLGYLIMKRDTRFLAVDKKDLAANAKEMKRALKKERATIVVCTLVVVLFLTCNIPFTVGIYQLKLGAAQTILLKLSATVNPLIYFFKGRLEKYYAKRKINLSSEMKTPEIKQKNARNGTAQTKIDISSIRQTSVAKVAANQGENGMNKTSLNVSDTLKIGQSLDTETRSNIGRDDANEPFRTISESLKIGQSLDTETRSNIGRDDANEPFRTMPESLKIGQSLGIEKGTNRGEDSANGMAHVRAESLNIGQSLETETGADRGEDGANGMTQTTEDDISRECFHQGIVNKAYDQDSLNTETTKL
eukprot:Seg3125.5 transcript_id=Seg3125.5/GoldUCD/mRNA.D3Y31 product=Pinopsin protein_id=Seg3125.5/GoldUCD/D3Y31